MKKKIIMDILTTIGVMVMFYVFVETGLVIGVGVLEHDWVRCFTDGRYYALAAMITGTVTLGSEIIVMINDIRRERKHKEWIKKMNKFKERTMED